MSDTSRHNGLQASPAGRRPAAARGTGAPRAYSKPALRRFGRIVETTLGPTFGAGESSGPTTFKANL